ncbi:MAG TPA: cyclomaltodextrinase, partial [Fervidobacterium sp.]|nr:cyclomaltodextrinase [Fervidobacterium sp.]
NHVSSQHRWFVQARRGNRDAMSKFTFYENGHRGWWGADMLPELNLEDLEVRNYITQVVEKYLKMGIDGWRLDCGQDLGPVNNAFIASKVKNVSIEKYVVSELWTYPVGWNMVDGIMNYHFRELVVGYLKRELDTIGGSLISAFSDTPNIYGCWNMLDSHDSERIASMIPDKSLRKLAIVLQFTYPGVPVVYYGSEIGMEGGKDPECRDTMKWDESKWDNDLREFYKKLIEVRKSEVALKVGSFEVLNEDPLIFLRKAPYMLDDIVVGINRDTERKVAVPIKDGRLLDRTRFADILTGEKFSLSSGLLKFDIPEKGFRLLRPLNDTVRGYDQYKRIF